MFEIYFCFIDIEAFGKLTELNDEDNLYNYSRCCIESMKVKFYEFMSEPKGFR